LSAVALQPELLYANAHHHGALFGDQKYNDLTDSRGVWPLSAMTGIEDMNELKNHYRCQSSGPSKDTQAGCWRAFLAFTMSIDVLQEFDKEMAGLPQRAHWYLH
jgi:hypothetical protein